MNFNKIRFRVWDTLNGEFINPSDIAITGNGNIILAHSGYRRDIGYYIDFQNKDNTNFIINRSTFLKDKNGKEIYEGDFVNLKFGECNWVGLVKWDKFLGLKYDKGGWTSMVGVEKYGEVIGNIIENPEIKVSNSIHT